MKQCNTAGALALGAAILAASGTCPAMEEPPLLAIPAISTVEGVREEGAVARLRNPIDAPPLQEYPANAWIGVSGRELVIEFEVAGSPGEASDVPRDDLRLFEGPVVEVFLGSAEDASHGYYHFATNPRGSIYDEVVRDGGWTRDPLWDAPLLVEPVEAQEEEAWAVRMLVPLAVLRRHLPDAPPRDALPEDLWFQLAAVSMQEDGGEAAVTWSPTAGSFHAPADFGRLSLTEPLPPLEGAVETTLTAHEGDVTARATLLGVPAEGTATFTVAGFLRRQDALPLLLPLFEETVTGGSPMREHALAGEEALNARYFVTRLLDDEGVLRDQLVQDWLYQEELPVLVTHERFRDLLELRLLDRPGGSLLRPAIHAAGGEASPLWATEHSGEGRRVEIDTSDWAPGIYELRWEQDGERYTVPLAKLPPSSPGVPDGWAFWGYMPDEELLAEFAAFAELTGGQEGLAGFIYGGSIDPVTAAMSAMNLDSLLAWRAALPGAELHLMIDGQGNFDLLDDDQVDAMARRLVDELMPVDEVTGLHFDLEPYRASQVRLTRALTKHGWTKPLSIATGLATTIPPEQWASIDYMVVMNYDLGKTPEIFTERASQNARAFARAARNHDRRILLGLPVIATHNEYAFMVEAESGDVVEGSPDASMMPFVNPALDIHASLRDDEELGEAIGAPVLWGALARGHHVGMRRYRYFPTGIEGDVWTRLVEFHEEAVAR